MFLWCSGWLQHTSGNGRQNWFSNHLSRGHGHGRYTSFEDLQRLTESPFENNTSLNLTVPLGDTAFLRCKVRNLGERSVSPTFTFAMNNMQRAGNIQLIILNFLSRFPGTGDETGIFWLRGRQRTQTMSDSTSYIRTAQMNGHFKSSLYKRETMEPTNARYFKCLWWVTENDLKIIFFNKKNS